MKFEKRHYEAVAQTLQDAAGVICEWGDNASGDAGAHDAHALIVRRFADMFQADNGRFNRERFMRACVPGANVRARTLPAFLRRQAE